MILEIHVMLSAATNLVSGLGTQR
uniref:Uncharacterized protein n=1 Tax=Arundo donax TaxID=35708 RepID=A0A0A9AX52_ARUDO